MSNPVIVVHYHEVWLKGRNRRFFLGKLSTALRQALQGVPVVRIEKPGDRFVVTLGEGASQQEAWRGWSEFLDCVLRTGANGGTQHGCDLPGGVGRNRAASF